jgi:hypothetical protein
MNDGTAKFGAITEQCSDRGRIRSGSEWAEAGGIEDAEVNTLEFFGIEVRGQAFLVDFVGSSAPGCDPRWFPTRSKEFFEDVCSKTNAVQIRCGCGHGR